MSKSEQIAGRQRSILELLAGMPKGKAEYSRLTEKLNESGYRVVDRSVRNDCKELFAGGLAVKVKKGAAITPEGLDFLRSQTVPESRLKEIYLKQKAVLKLLYDRYEYHPAKG